MSPILPHNRALYPKDWPSIRAKILERAQQRCEWCGIPNHETVVRTSDGQWWTPDEVADGALYCYDEALRAVRIVLTIAHLDHDPRNCADDNLAALCQQCHNRYDRKHRDHTRRYGCEVGQLALELGA